MENCALLLTDYTNALGNIVAVLQEYNFTKNGDNNGQFSCKLYRTKEGNWYDIEEAKLITEKGIDEERITEIARLSVSLGANGSLYHF